MGYILYLAVNIILPKSPNIKKSLLYYLQSDIVYYWLKYIGKVKGNQLQIDGKPLRAIPVPDFTHLTGEMNMKNVVEL